MSNKSIRPVDRLILQNQIIQSQILEHLSLTNVGHMNHFASLMLNLSSMAASIGMPASQREKILQNVQVVLDNIDRLEGLNKHISHSIAAMEQEIENLENQNSL
ncbi:hypothetical protein F5984_08970 [Rudanella paleaurantiibacter]|uniref:Uncharacterized protein n=1 Tax=Rudanella paleaurantiibacter TaxID=2614655 RepID=A0A7J5TZN8_9BACT|nr:hypothetical protein [Rudanella paleaurantiibacter]KAB7730953.1 hypothetical protein F5984_08970 [Rudanella paleaurantiibacter]